MKIIILFLFLVLTNSKLFIKRIHENKLKDFLAYRSTMYVSPYKNDEIIKSSALENYLPVRVKLDGHTSVTLRKSEGESKKKKKKK